MVIVVELLYLVSKFEKIFMHSWSSPPLGDEFKSLRQCLSNHRILGILSLILGLPSQCELENSTISSTLLSSASPLRWPGSDRDIPWGRFVLLQSQGCQHKDTCLLPVPDSRPEPVRKHKDSLHGGWGGWNGVEKRQATGRTSPRRSSGPDPNPHSHPDGLTRAAQIFISNFTGTNLSSPIDSVAWSEGK